MKVLKLSSLFFFVSVLVLSFAFKTTVTGNSYQSLYFDRLSHTDKSLSTFIESIKNGPLIDKTKCTAQLHVLRAQTKALDFWLRYFEPLSYKKINGPLPVEWETEVFEKFEKPYRREGAGLTLAELYLQEADFEKDSLLALLNSAQKALLVIKQDSITRQLQTPEHFFFCNRLFLLNLAAIYTTGFENPTAERIVPELRMLINETAILYNAFNSSNSQFQLSADYLALYQKLHQFVNEQPDDVAAFDHYTFIKNFINPLFKINQEHIRKYGLKSHSVIDYSLNNRSNSIFAKDLYTAQNIKGIYSRVTDPLIQQQIWELGRQLFYDPILSGNNQRSCASCHKPEFYFADTTVTTHLQFDKLAQLPRNTPSLINSTFNHLLMHDGSKNTLLEQAHSVITNSLEMNCKENDILKKVTSCDNYKKTLNQLISYTPQLPVLSIEHITSALTSYYGSFSASASAFDEAMNGKKELSPAQQKGFNLFVSKAQCATCHFVPYFNGVKPPYVSSEFEVIGVPRDTAFTALSADKGRYNINAAPETLHAFRTGTLRNIAGTSPYMHNGVFKTLRQVIDFYDAGGGAGRGLKVENQTLSADSLHLTALEKNDLIEFLNSLTENVNLPQKPQELARSSKKYLQVRQPGGTY